MKKIKTAALSCAITLSCAANVFADTAQGQQKGLLNIPWLPSWAPRVVILLLLLFLAVRPMIPDYLEQRKRRKQK